MRNNAWMEGSDDPSAGDGTHGMYPQCATPKASVRMLLLGPLRKHGRSCAPTGLCGLSEALGPTPQVSHAVISPLLRPQWNRKPHMDAYHHSEPQGQFRSPNAPKLMQGSRHPAFQTGPKAGREQTQHHHWFPITLLPDVLCFLVPQTESKLKSLSTLILMS